MNRLLKWIIGISLAAVGAFTVPVPASAQNIAVRGWCEEGATPVLTSGLTSTTKVQASYPACTVTVNITGGGTATIYSDASGTPLANPFTASSNGQWIFFVAPTITIDVVNSGGGLPAPVTYSSILVGSGGGGGGSGYQIVASNGTTQPPQPILNLVSGANTTVTCANSPPNTRTDCTISSSGSGVIAPGTTGNVTEYTGPTALGDSGVAANTLASTAADNIWQMDQRFKGPIPFRDVTAYMPPGGCAFGPYSGGPSPNPPSTVSISAMSRLATFTGDAYINGCGVAIPNAGPLSVATPPQGGSTVSAISHSGTQFTLTCVTNCNLDLSVANAVFGIQISGCTDGTLNGTYAQIQILSNTQIVGAPMSSSGTTVTGCVWTALFGYPAGATGSTAYNYKFVSIDPSEGYSAASAPIAIANGNSTLDWGNYNVVQFDSHGETPWYGVYRGTPTTSVSVSDSFARSDGGLGGNWTTVSPATAPQIASNQVVGSSGFQVANWSANAFGNDQTSQVTYTGVTNGNATSLTSVFVRNTSGNGYLCTLFDGEIILAKGTLTNFVGSISSATQAFTSGDILKISAVGMSISCSLNGTTLLSATDNSYGGGSAGIQLAVFGGGGGASLDNWVGTAAAGDNYTCVGATATNAFVDHGWTVFPCPVFLPSSPPVTAGNQTLYTTVASQSGNALTLTVAASASVTGGNMYHDDSTFLTACLSDSNNDNGGVNGPLGAGAFGCYIPTGVLALEGPTPLSTGTQFARQRPGRLQIAGGIQNLTQPIFIETSGWKIECTGTGGFSSGGSFDAYPQCPIVTGNNVPIAMAVRANTIYVDGFSMSANGYALFVNSSAGIHFNHMELDATATGSAIEPSPLFVGGNVLPGPAPFLDNSVVTSAGKGNPAITFGVWEYGNNTDCCLIIDHLSTALGNVLFEGPGIANSPTGWQTIQILNWLSESTLNGGSQVDFDNRATAPGSPGRSSLFALTVNGSFADAFTNTVIHKYDNNDTNVVQFLSTAGGPPNVITCGPDARLPSLPACAGSPGLISSNLTGSFAGPVPEGTVYANNIGSQLSVGYPFYLRPQPVGSGTENLLSASLPTPDGFAFTSTDTSGSLVAGTYCMFYIGVDSQSSPGTTFPSNEVCPTVSSSGRIFVTASNPTQFYGYSNMRLYFGTTGPGSESAYVLTGPPPASFPDWNYTFSSTSGSTPGTAADGLGTAATSYIMSSGELVLAATPPLDASSNDTNILTQVVIGSHAPNSKAKLDVLGLTRSSGFAGALAVKTLTYTLTYADSWINVTGSNTIVAPHALVGMLWTVFNSGAGTVVLQPDSGTINGTSSVTIFPNTGVTATCDGTNCFSHGTPFTFAGNTSKVATVSGTLTNGHCLSADANQNVVDSGVLGCSGSGGGGVTSVAQSFTGGLISVGGSPITTSGTLALTVAGTSGGIPYFASSSTWASSGALTANLPMFGGGAGSSPIVGTRSGNTTEVATITGSLTSGHGIVIDASGNLIDSGSTGTSANAALSNLSGVAINTTLLPGAAGAENLGTAPLPFGNLFLGGSANHAASFVTSALSTNRNITVPDAATILPQANAGTAGQFLTALSGTTGAFSVSSLTYTGNTTKLATSTGSLTPTDVVVIDASGNFIDGGTAVSSSSTNTFTNKTINQEGTGNVITTVQEAYFDAAGCNNATAAPSFDLPSSGAPTPNCLAGTNTIQGTLDFDDSGPESGQIKFALPHTWTGAIDLQLYWVVTTSGGSNAVKWTIATAFTAGAATFDTAYNAPQTITTNVAANNILVTSAQSALTLTGSAVDDLMHVKIGRDTTDTFTGTARLIGVRLTLRKTGS